MTGRPYCQGQSRARTDTFLKLEAEASGYPSWVRTPNDEVQYIESFRQSEGILLDKDSIKFNAAKQGLAKLCLNSLWGKMTENQRKTQTKLISDPQEQYRFLPTPGIQVTNLLIAGDDEVWAAWYNVEEAHMPNLRHDVIGSYVTAGARLHLYGYIDKLQERALYTDTDNVVFIQPRDGAALVEIGDCLGVTTSELKPDEIISEFVSGGPKKYANKMLNSVTRAEKTVCKVRGITLNYKVSQLVNFEKFREMILRRNEKETVIEHTASKIKR